MKIFYRFLLPLICAVYLSLIAGRYLFNSVSKTIFLGIILFVLLLNIFDTVTAKFSNKRSFDLKAFGLSVLLAVLILLAGGKYLIPGIKPIASTVITLTATGDKNKDASASEIWLVGVSNNGLNYDLGKIDPGNAWQRKEGAILSVPAKQPGILRFAIADANALSLTFIKHAWSGKVKISSGDQQDIIDLYKAGAGEQFKYEIKNQRPPADSAFSSRELLFSLLPLVFLIITCYLLVVLLLNRIENYYLLNTMLGVILFVVADYLSFDWIHYLFLFATTIFTGVLLSKAVRSGFTRNFTRWDKVILIIIALYGSFAFLGNLLFLITNTNIHKIAFYLLFAIWLIPLEIGFLYITAGLGRRLAGRRYERQPGLPPDISVLSGIKLRALFFFIFAAIWCIYLYAFFPGAMTPDSLDQWGQAIGATPLNNWHPVFHTLSIRMLIGLYKSPAAVAFAQILYMALVSSGFLLLLYKRGIPGKWLAVFAVLFAILPCNGVMLITLWKDIPFTISLLWLTLILTTLACDSRYSARWLIIPELAIALTFAALFRHNGIVVYILAVAVLLLYSYKNKNIKVALGVIVSAALIGAFNLLVLNRPDVKPNSPAVKLVAPIHGLAAVIYNEAGLPPEVMEKMKTILPEQEWAAKFTPYSAIDYLFNTNHLFTDHLEKFSTAEAFKMYGTAFIHHPYIIARDRLQGIDYIWNVTAPPGIVTRTYTTEIQENHFGLSQHEKRSGMIIRKYLGYSAVYADMLWWRVGLLNFLLLLLLFYCWKNHPKAYLMTFLPWVAGVLSLLPAMVDQEFRYVYFIYMLFGFIWLFVISGRSKSMVSLQIK